MPQKFPDITIPKTAVLELTNRCNHRCIFCSAPWDAPTDKPAINYECQGEMSTQQWKDCIDFFIEKKLAGFAFTGGEPFLRPDIFELIDYVNTRKALEPEFDTDGKVTGYQHKKPEFTLITNGRLLDNKKAELLKDKVDSVVVSLPGLESYSELTGGGDPQKALDAIKMLNELEIPVVVSICVTTKNFPELFENISAGFLAGADQLLLNRFLPGGRGTIHQELCLNKEQLQQMLHIADEVCVAANRYGTIGTELPLCLCPNDLKMLQVGTQCSGGVDFFAVAPDGNVRPCNHSPVNLGHYSKIEQAIAGDYWQTFKTRQYLPEMCEDCSQILRCDGGCREAAHIVGGTLDSPDPIFSN
jgi:radical SAM protein with 4Fe4S-binding SPASM domain